MPNGALVTPVYIKASADMKMPEADSCYYLVTGSGLYIGRNTRLLRSLVPTTRWPRELVEQQPDLEVKHPKVSGALLGRITGFLWTIADRCGGEAVVLLALDEQTGAIQPIVPPQTATVGWSWRGEAYPIGLYYDIPPLAEQGLTLIGDIHSHGFESAYASAIDVKDEQHWPGLHVVAGRLNQDPPQWHVEYVVDGIRFDMPPDSVLDIEGYTGRTLPADDTWVSRVHVEHGLWRPGDDNGTCHTGAAGGTWTPREGRP